MARLSKQPDIRIETLAELAGIAKAISAEALRQYNWLAEEMRRRGRMPAVAAFDALEAEEKVHLLAVEDWARGLGITPYTEDFRRPLPEELARNWKEESRSALLTPYRAYALAVGNEARAFAFFAYLAASAGDAGVARGAEHLAMEKLRHAAQLRILRRAAWHSERDAAKPQIRVSPTASAAELESMIAEHEARIARCHGTVAGRLRGLQDIEGADLLAKLAATARKRAGTAGTDGDLAEPNTADHALGLLVSAQVPLEQLCEVLDSVLLASVDETTRIVAETAMESAVERIAELGHYAGQLE